ncbi:MAG: general secretion pathway protein GspB [Nitrospirota bacterium]
MSYILDALKKSEKERQRGTPPDILTAQDVEVQKPKKRPLWPYLLLVVLLLNTGVLILWLGPWHSKKPNLVAQSSVGQQHEISDDRLPIASPSSNKSETIGRETKELQQDQTKQAKADLKKDAPGVPTPMADTKTSREDSLSLPEQSLVVSHVPSEPKTGNDIPPPVEGKVYNLNELPSSIQQNLPAFTISAAVYSDDPASRMMKINGQSMHEGEYLTAGLKLEEITPDGVIFSYQKYRFRVGLK